MKAMCFSETPTMEPTSTVSKHQKSEPAFIINIVIVAIFVMG
jgi:hypothetical protein